MCYKMITADTLVMFLVLSSQVNSIFGAIDVAINKPTRQSTINLGVNTSSWDGLTAWWCIDLRQEFQINTVKISKPNHDGRNKLLDGFEMKISSSGQCDKAGFTAATPCYKDRTRAVDSAYTIERCNHPAIPSLSARYIFVSVKRTDTRLDICEVQVFADNCPDGFYGTNCNIRCPTTCLNNTCDKIDGSCSHGCHGDHYGKRCQSTCSSNCKDGKCDDRTGRCFGCEDGYYGDMCEESCSTCNGPCRQLDGVCLTGCKDGYWGSNGLCLQNCSYCESGDCRIEDGVCYNGCKLGQSNTKCNEDNCPDGFYGTNCNIRCPTTCLNNTCDKIGGSCSHGCHGDHYGKKCQSTCSSHCKDGKCDDRTGRCFGCEDGYYGDMCEESCSTCNGSCRQLDGVCFTGCKDGYWGSNGLCLQNCSYCESGDCRIEDGVCYNGCKLGLSNTKCDQVCRSLPSRLHALAEIVQEKYSIGAIVNYKCIEGAYPVGSPQARCLLSGEWDISSFTCKIARTCHEAHQLGASVTPTLVVKPDIEHPALTVSCEVTDNGVYTVFGHHGANRTYVHGFEEPRSYIGTINYKTDLQQVINIVNASAECEQFIKFECHHVHTITSVGLATRTGELATYIIGGARGQMDCACHINNNCADGLKCNCDKNDEVLRVDEGYIRYKEDLPITAILVGDTGHSQEYAYYTVGNLRCKG